MLDLQHFPKNSQHPYCVKNDILLKCNFKKMPIYCGSSNVQTLTKSEYRTNNKCCITNRGSKKTSQLTHTTLQYHFFRVKDDF